MYSIMSYSKQAAAVHRAQAPTPHTQLCGVCPAYCGAVRAKTQGPSPH